MQAIANMTNVPPGWISVRDSGWLSAGHNLTEVDLKRCMLQLAQALQPLHREDRLYARISLDDVFIDADGILRIAAGLAVPADTWVESEALCDVNRAGFAAFEQHADDPAWPLGPWTDIYGMCALIRTLILKQSPPDAVQRMVSDACDPLRGMAMPAYSREFLGVIDRGMSLLPQLRFSSIDDFSDLLGLSQLVPAAQEQNVAAVPVAPALNGGGAPAVYDDMEADEGSGIPDVPKDSASKKAPVWMIGFVAAMLIALGAWWLQDDAVDPSVAASAPTQDATTAPAAVTDSEAAPAPPASVPALTDIEPSSPELSPPAAPAIEPTAVAPPATQPEAETLQDTALNPEPEMQESTAPTPEPVVADTAPKPQAQESAAPATTASNVNVQLSILPWGEVFLNGVSRGVSPPVKILSLKPGQYRVKVVNGDLPPYQQQLTVQAGKPTAISHSFE